MNRRIRIYVEVIANILLWLIPTYLILRYDLMSFGDLTGKYYRLPLITSVLINITFVYSNILFLFPLLRRKKLKIYIYTLIIALLATAIAYLKVRIDSSFMIHYFSRLTVPEHDRFWMELFISLFFAAQSLLYSIVRDWIKNRIIEKRLLEEKLSLELKYLKSQINPHFLFNTLNNLYAVALKNNDDETAEGITKLSNIMRFMLEEVNENMVPLGKEINYLRSYIDLQKLRFGEHDDINTHFETKGEIEGVRLPPFIFIVFIENAFKYGIDYGKPSFIDIRLEVLKEKLILNVRNSVHGAIEKSGQGIGLKNVRERLDLIYSGNYNLEITADDDIFKVELVINLSLSK